jgi:hypothetical protein
MIYDHLGQEATMTTTASSSGFRSFFRPMARFFPRFFPIQPVYNFPPPCTPVPVPPGTYGRDSYGNLTVNGSTWCSNPQPPAVLPYRPINLY